PPSQWKSIRTSNAIERLHEEFKRRIKTQTVLPCAETAAMMFWALLASGQITMRKVDGWQTLSEKPTDQVTPKLGESGMSQVAWKGHWLVDFSRRQAANQNQGWDGSPDRSRRVDRRAETSDRGA